MACRLIGAKPLDFPPDWRQAINWPNAGMLLIGRLAKRFGETWMKICRLQNVGHFVSVSLC